MAGGSSEKPPAGTARSAEAMEIARFSSLRRRGTLALERAPGGREETRAMPASILIADDDPNIVLALRFLMEKEGYRVRVATDGEAALTAIAEDRPDLVVLDVMMPRRNGFDVCAAVRADPELAATRIVMLTAKGLDGERNRGLRAGADDYVTKPFATRDVLERVRQLLGASGARAPGGAGG
jgi:DNA-binding response OmpR family regulator